MGTVKVLYNDDLTSLALPFNRVPPTSLTQGLDGFYFTMKNTGFSALNAVTGNSAAIVGTPSFLAGHMASSAEDYMVSENKTGAANFTIAFVVKNGDTSAETLGVLSSSGGVADSYLFLTQRLATNNMELWVSSRDKATGLINGSGVKANVDRGAIGDFDMYVATGNSATGEIAIHRPKASKKSITYFDETVLSLLAAEAEKRSISTESSVAVQSADLSLLTHWNVVLTDLEIKTFYGQMKKSLSVVGISI